MKITNNIATIAVIKIVHVPHLTPHQSIHALFFFLRGVAQRAHTLPEPQPLHERAPNNTTAQKEKDGAPRRGHRRLYCTTEVGISTMPGDVTVRSARFAVTAHLLGTPRLGDFGGRSVTDREDVYSSIDRSDDRTEAISDGSGTFDRILTGLFVLSNNSD